MTGRQFEAMLREIWPDARDINATAAKVLEVHKTTVWRWCNGESPISKIAILAVQYLKIEKIMRKETA